MSRRLVLAGAAALIVAAFSIPASAQIAPGRTIDPSARTADSIVEQVTAKKKRPAKKAKSNVRSKSYSWQNVRGSSSPVYMPNGRGMR